MFAGGEVLYVDENVNYMIVRGRPIDVARQTDLTEERTRVLTAIEFDQLPLKSDSSIYGSRARQRGSKQGMGSA